MQDKDRRDTLREIYQREDTSNKTFIPAKPKINPNERDRFFRVCAYCRVSTDNDEQLSSFELQQAHYKQLVQDHPNWELKHIFADQGISGTSLKNRDEFNEMIAACKRGEYDLILTKSVSRFARNLVDCISLIRMLKGLTPPVGVFFETDNLYTLGENTEFMLSFLATFAQEESVKKSEAMNWSLHQRFKDGKLLTPAPLGYDRQRDSAGHYIKYAPLQINESEARIVRFIYDAYLAGWSQESIAGFLTDIGCQTKTGSTEWKSHAVSYILTNERYCGSVLTWKTFTADLYEHKHKKNRQDRDQYLYPVIKPYWKELFRFASDKAPKVRLAFIWASENIATNMPDIYEDHIPIFEKLLHDVDDKVRMESPEIFRVLGKRRPEFVRPYVEQLRQISETDENHVVRIHCLGAIKAMGLN